MSAEEPASSQQGNGDYDDESRVSTLELFFDLVFVFAFTQVTGFLATI